MCMIPMIIILMYAGLALGPLLAGELDETYGTTSGKEDEEKENT